MSCPVIDRRPAIRVDICNKLSGPVVQLCETVGNARRFRHDHPTDCEDALHPTLGFLELGTPEALAKSVNAGNQDTSSSFFRFRPSTYALDDLLKMGARKRISRAVAAVVPDLQHGNAFST